MHKARDYAGVDPECFQHLIPLPRDSVWYLRERATLEQLNTLGMLVGFERLELLTAYLITLWKYPDRLDEFQKQNEERLIERGFK